MKKMMQSAGVVALATLASRILGMARDILMGAFFGATGATDAFYVAFRIPNLVRRFVGEGVLTISFIPVYTEYLLGRGEDDALDLARKTLTVLLVILAAAVSLGILFAGGLSLGFDDPARARLATTLTRIMFPYVFLVGIVAFCMGYLNSRKYFLAPAAAPVLLNVGIIAGIIFLSRFFAEPLYGVSVGVLAGGLMQILLQFPSMARAGFRMKFSFDHKHPGLRKIFRQALLGVPAMGIQQINTLVITLMAMTLAEGSVSYIYFSDRLNELVMGVFVVSLGTAALPEMAELAAKKQFKTLIDVYARSMKLALFMAVPATVALMIIGLPIISVLLMHNRFTAREAEMTYRALLYAGIGITGAAAARITIPAYYAIGDSRTPFYAALASFVINAGAAAALMRTSLAHGGLTLSVSIASTAQMFILVFFLRKRLGDIGLTGIVKSSMRYAAAAGAMGAFLWFAAGLVQWTSGGFTGRALSLGAIIIAGGAVYATCCYGLGVEEMRYLVGKISGRVKLRRR